MTIDISWYLPKRIVYACSNGVTDASMIAAANQKIDQLIEEGTAPLYLISDERQIKKVLMSLHMLRDTFKHLSRFSCVVAIGRGDAIGRFMARVLAQWFRVQYHTFETLDEALEFLKGYDPGLPPLDDLGDPCGD